MTTEVNWVLEQLGSVVDDVANSYTNRNDNPVALKRVNRDDSSVYEGGGSLDFNEPMHKRKEDLKSGVFVGATLADRAEDPAGTEYNLKIETVVGLTVGDDVPGRASRPCRSGRRERHPVHGARPQDPSHATRL